MSSTYFRAAVALLEVRRRVERLSVLLYPNAGLYSDWAGNLRAAGRDAGAAVQIGKDEAAACKGVFDALRVHRGGWVL